MGFIKNQLLKVIEWQDDTHDTIIYRFPIAPKQEIMMGSQLIVAPSQVAIFVSSGKIADVFEPGRYKLDTGNMPVLTKLMSWKYGFNSPFVCDVFYVSTKQFINMKWGTANPIMMRDKDFGMVRFRAFGTFAFKVANPVVFFKDVAGTLPSYKVSSLVDHLKSMIISGIGEAVAASSIPALDLAMQLSRLTDDTRRIVLQRFTDMGIELASMAIENISLPEEVEKAMDKRTSMGALGDVNTYTAFQAADSMRDMAANAHKAQGMNIGGMGMMMGTGYAMTNMMGGAIQSGIQTGQNQANINREMDQRAAEDKYKREAAAAAEAEKIVRCPICNAQNAQNAKFCLNCGASMVTGLTCQKCGRTVKPDAKFCPECGEKVSAQKSLCPKCGVEVKAGTKFCPECGSKI